MDSQDSSITRVVFVRHGQSDFNEQARFQGSSNQPRLTDKGWATAVQCGHYLSATRFDSMLCSPLRRAKETAKGIRMAFLQAGRQLPPLTYDDRLREIHLPGWEGLSFKTVRELYPAAFHVWKETPHLLKLPLSQSNRQAVDMFSPLEDMCVRSRQFWHDTLASRCGQTILVVSHGAAITALLCVALGVSSKNIHLLQQSNGGVTAVDLSGRMGEKARLLFANRTQHLGEFLPKIKGDRCGIRVVLLTQECADRNQWTTVRNGSPLGFIGARSSPGLVAEAFMQAGNGQLNTFARIVPEGNLGQEDIACLRLDMWRRPGLHIERDAITVLHYPRINEPPVLQAMNVAASPGTLCEL